MMSQLELIDMNAIIMAATRQDLERIIEIYSSPELERNPEESRWFVSCYFDYHHINLAKVDGEIRGTCLWRVEGEISCCLGWIENLWVDRKHRNRGLGEMLLKKSIEDMIAFYDKKGHKLRKVVLTTQSYRGGAVKLYEKVGFKKVAEISDMYDPEGCDFVYMIDVQGSISRD